MSGRAKCAHPATGWTVTRGIATCTACGVRRFHHYGALWRDNGEYVRGRGRKQTADAGR
ncbi:hypothetical protein FHS39_001961 [Streptomyces olivoverticillatus]|uniref:Uncharacterized protein n=1 Tax=Streptomyces olivoverticillatus TaxID=66427 RepID=A0A7W7LMI5_9ACTN|nr:hypothetical protein [Streptomyces olivoverticillatus]